MTGTDPIADAATGDAPPNPGPAASTGTGTRRRISRKAVTIASGILVLVVVSLACSVSRLREAFDTVSTDDAYVNSHVTIVATRVPGYVTRVHVDDNNRVRKGDLLLEIDSEPYEVQLRIQQAAVDAARADLVAATSQMRGALSQACRDRFKLAHAIEEVQHHVALLRANVATLESRKATRVRAQADLERSKLLLSKGAISREEFDHDEEAFQVSEALVTEASEQVHRIRLSLGLPAEPPAGQTLGAVPHDLEQNCSTVRQVLADLLLSHATLGIYPDSYDVTPRQLMEELYGPDSRRNVDRSLEVLLKNAPPVKQAEARLLKAERDLEQARLNRQYCRVFSEIDGVVTRRNVNQGNNVQSGQALMGVRSLTEIWIDANFKETQLVDLRIGHRVEIEADMYGSRRRFGGRISGFTMGTGATFALLPPQNATGNFVKVVQRLPVRIELDNYDHEIAPLFVGLSVTPRVFIREPACGPHAGRILQPGLLAPRLDAEVASESPARSPEIAGDGP